LHLHVQALLFYACCFTEKAGYYKSKLARFTEDPGVTGYRCVCLLRATQLPSWGLAVSLVSLSQTCRFYRRHSCATFCASEVVQRKVCWLTCCVRKDRRLNTDLRFALASKLVPVAGPTVTYGPYCSLSSEPPLCRNEPRVRVEERRLKTEADLNSANPSLFTELPFTRCGKGLRLASA